LSLDLKDDSDEGCDDDITAGGRLLPRFCRWRKKQCTVKWRQ